MLENIHPEVNEVESKRMIHTTIFLFIFLNSFNYSLFYQVEVDLLSFQMSLCLAEKVSLSSYFKNK